MTVDFSLAGKVALVTGASRGIGEAIARTLADYGAEVILVGRKIDGLTAVHDRIATSGGSSAPLACHMGNLDDIDRLFETVANTYGRLDILVNNAGTNPYFGPVINAEERAWDKTHDVNLKGPFFATKKAAALMMTGAGGGAIVNVASINGIRPAPLQGIYSITKAGVIMMTKVFALELAEHNIRVNAILPGVVKTRFASALFENDDIYNNIIDRTPMKRHAEPMEMAAAGLYFVSDSSSFTTGTCLVCDGGMTL